MFFDLRRLHVAYDNLLKQADYNTLVSLITMRSAQQFNKVTDPSNKSRAGERTFKRDLETRLFLKGR